MQKLPTKITSFCPTLIDKKTEQKTSNLFFRGPIQSRLSRPHHHTYIKLWIDWLLTLRENRTMTSICITNLSNNKRLYQSYNKFNLILSHKKAVTFLLRNITAYYFYGGKEIILLRQTPSDRT